MIHGHGDDLYKYKNVEMNFSTNIFNHFDHSRLFAYLSEKLPLITSYPINYQSYIIPIAF